ncbi:MAG: TetR/AcrR family transcriptional regulator [Desulfobacula sp.]|nr:TetR/AcrR family transcriptional regulator [Desulfobacula sp.]
MKKNNKKINTTDPKAQKILVAVRTILAKKGYMGTTISAVAEEAGVSRGLLHYYFKNKEEMLARVIKENMEVSIVMVTSIFEQFDSPKGYAKAITELLRGVMENDPDFFNLFFEGFAVARQSQVVNRELAMLYGKFRLALETGLSDAREKGKISPGLPVDALAAIITGIIDGMGIQLLTEPELCQDAVIWQSIERAVIDLLIEKK